MAILKAKWFLFIVIPILVLVVLYFLGRKSVHAELMIPSTPAGVWVVLMDVPAYKEWNPVLIPVEGELMEQFTWQGGLPSWRNATR